MEPKSEVKKAIQLGTLVLGIFVAGMVTMAVGTYLLIANSGKIINLVMGGKLASTTASLPGLSAVTQLMNHSSPVPGIPGADGQGTPDISKMMAQLSPEARQLLMQMLQNQDSMSGLQSIPHDPSDPKN